LSTHFSAIVYLLIGSGNLYENITAESTAAHVTHSPMKFCLAISEVGYFRTSCSETVLPSFDVFFAV
jgi:hypothetical protein